jgi:hypothetical protein
MAWMVTGWIQVKKLKFSRERYWYSSPEISLMKKGVFALYFTTSLPVSLILT